MKRRRVIMKVKHSDGRIEVWYSDGTHVISQRRPEDRRPEGIRKRWETYYKLHPEKKRAKRRTTALQKALQQFSKMGIPIRWQKPKPPA